jgi:cytochrome c oxidase assembly factor CtaG
VTGTALGTFVLEGRGAQNAPLAIACLAGVMYWRGGRGYRAARRLGTIAPARVRVERWRTAALVAAALAAVLALQEPVDALADELFWMHMVQHVLLLVVVAPLAVLAAPWMRLWRALPLRLRRTLARWEVNAGTAAPLRALARALGNPWVAWALLAGDLIAWHVPAAYDLTLRSEAVHYSEHASFLLFAMLAWGQVIDSPPFHSRLDAPYRVAFALGAMAVGWGLALMLAFASQPWYSGYAALAHRPGGISALTDQHLGAGVMWVPASLPWALAVFVLVYRWVPDVQSRRTDGTGGAGVAGGLPSPAPPSLGDAPSLPPLPAALEEALRRTPAVPAPARTNGGRAIITKARRSHA